MPSSLFSQSRPFWRLSLMVWWCTRTPTCETGGTCLISSSWLLGKFSGSTSLIYGLASLNVSDAAPAIICWWSVSVWGLGFALGPVSTVAVHVRGLVCAKVAEASAPHSQVLIETLKHTHSIWPRKDRIHQSFTTTGVRHHLPILHLLSLPDFLLTLFSCSALSRSSSSLSNASSSVQT